MKGQSNTENKYTYYSNWKTGWMVTDGLEDVASFKNVEHAIFFTGILNAKDEMEGVAKNGKHIRNRLQNILCSPKGCNEESIYIYKSLW